MSSSNEQQLEQAIRRVFLAAGICIGIAIGAAFAALDYSQGWGIAHIIPAAQLQQFEVSNEQQ